MDFNHFVTLFKSILLQGFARPRGGVRTLLTLLVKKFRALGGTLRMQSGVRQLEVADGGVECILLDSGEALTARTFFSSAGYPETMKLCGPSGPESTAEVGRLSFVETILVLNRTPPILGHDATVVFFNDTDRFRYAQPDDPVDLQSGIVCSPNNYAGQEDAEEGLIRLTWLANYEQWRDRDQEAYAQLKKQCLTYAISTIERFIPNVRDHIVATDMFTPRTIEQYTARLGGAVYGSPRKRRDGRTHLRNLFICGTDQGFLGIIGAMLSGITMANLHVLAEE